MATCLERKESAHHGCSRHSPVVVRLLMRLCERSGGVHLFRVGRSLMMVLRGNLRNGWRRRGVVGREIRLLGRLLGNTLRWTERVRVRRRRTAGRIKDGFNIRRRRGQP